MDCRLSSLLLTKLTFLQAKRLAMLDSLALYLLVAAGSSILVMALYLLVRFRLVWVPIAGFWRSTSWSASE